MAFPYGDRWSDHVRDLVAALYIAASHEIVHRDVRQANMMLWPGANAAIGEGEDPSKSRAYLIDWGFAAAVDTVVEYAGTGCFASQRVLKRLEKDQRAFEVQFADDAASLVKSMVFMVELHGDHTVLPGRDQCNSDLLYSRNLRKYWDELFSLKPAWKATYQVALKCTSANAGLYTALYDALCETIGTSLAFSSRLRVSWAQRRAASRQADSSSSDSSDSAATVTK